MVIEGKLLEKFETQNVTNTFRKREFVIEYAENPQYPEFVKFELIQNNCEQLDQLNVGDTISINFNLKGRKWTDPKGEVKYFNSLQAWRIDQKQGTQPEQSMPQQDAPPPPDETWMSADNAQDDDLPF